MLVVCQACLQSSEDFLDLGGARRVALLLGNYYDAI
jgi:hypothetical protein